jgi:predicted nucleic acid-binding protein
MAAEPVLVDTNVLVEATDERRKHHRSAFELVENRPGLTLCAQVIREYLVVATRPAARAGNGLGLSLPEALQNIAAFRERMRLLPEEKPVLPALFKLLDSVRCSGKRIHDANVVATAMTHGVHAILTFNLDDFRGFRQHIELIDPTAAR